MVDLNGPKPKEDKASKVTTSQGAPKKQEERNLGKDTVSQLNGPKTLPAPPAKGGGPLQSSTAKPPEITDDNEPTPGDFPQWLNDKRKQIEEEVQQEEADKIATLHENTRKYEERKTKTDDQGPKKKTI